MTKYNGNILIIDDNKELLSALKMYLEQYFEKVHTESNPNTIPSLLREQSFDIILLDMNFKAGVSSGNEGIYWLHQIHEIDPDVSVLFITAYGDVELAVKSLKEGAADFIQKSWDEEKILSTVISAYKLRQSKLEIKQLKKQQKHLTEETNREKKMFICHSEPMQRVYQMVEKVAATDANILITGENGTGKEVIAREIHSRSKRRDKIFVNVDLGAITANLFESELFGHCKGAFTDAKNDRTGRFEIASGGTLFLDEIGNLPLNLQTKLLSALQTRAISRMGENKSIPVDIRLISATNQPLFDMVENKQFREDLLYRINTIRIDIPPLRERPEDIPDMAEFFFEQFREKYQKNHLHINKQEADKLKRHNWPGNIRELQHAVEKAVILSEESSIKADLILPDKTLTHHATPETFNLEENEKRIIEEALQKHRGNISLTAEKLGINRSTLYAKMNKYDLK
jgi:DNA-binding NtrC family response regulator